MNRRMTRVVLGAFLLALVLPSLVSAGVPRVRALAGGDARFLPDDDGTIAIFPNRLSEHRRIVLHNIDPGGSGSSSSGLEAIEDAETWGEASWDMFGGVMQVGVNRPTISTAVQEAFASVNPAAHSMLDIGYANNGNGYIGNLGIADGGGDANLFLEGVLATEMGVGREVAFSGAYNRIDDENLFDFGLNLRTDRGGGTFFDHVVAGGFWDHGSDFDTFGLDGNLLHYNGDNRRGRNGLVHLIAVGGRFEYTSVDMTGADGGAFAIPNITAGAEYDATGWLTVRGSVTRDFVFEIDDNPRDPNGVEDEIGAGETTVTVGASGRWGDFRVDAVIENAFVEDGPDFIGGNASGISSFVSLHHDLQ